METEAAAAGASWNGQSDLIGDLYALIKGGFKSSVYAGLFVM